jgi:hypothetical protein
LVKSVVSFRKDLNAEKVPFIAGELGEFFAQGPGKRFPYSLIVNEQIHLLPSRAPLTAVVSAKGRAVKEFGLRYAEAWLRLSSNP